MKLLVTGGTGYLGSEVVPRLLARGHDLLVLTREKRESLHPRLQYITADITQDHPNYRPIDGILHMAALTSLRRKRTEEDFLRPNVQGTINMGSLARQYGVPFYYVSTLYVSGTFGAYFTEEDFSVGQDWKNPYERSKFAAESWIRTNVPDYVIFRPGILLGRYHDGGSSAFEGFYRPLKAIVFCEQVAEGRLGLPSRRSLEGFLHLPPMSLPIKIKGSPESTLALTPVDSAAEAIARRIDDRNIGRTFHLAPKVAPTNEQVASAVREALHITGLAFAPSGGKDPLSITYNRLVSDFLPYLTGHAQYQTSIAPDEIPAIDTEYLMRVINYWRRMEDTYAYLPQGARGEVAV